MDAGAHEVHIAYRQAALQAAAREARLGTQERPRILVVGAARRAIGRWLAPSRAKGRANRGGGGRTHKPDLPPCGHGARGGHSPVEGTPLRRGGSRGAGRLRVPRAASPSPHTAPRGRGSAVS